MKSNMVRNKKIQADQLSDIIWMRASIHDEKEGKLNSGIKVYN